MDKVSVTRPSSPSTRSILADDAFCAQVSALLMCDQEPIRKAFIDEPVEEVLEMVRWALSHEDDEGFDPTKVLTSWAQKRERGAWSTKLRKFPRAKQNPKEKLAEMLIDYWTEHPEELVTILNRVEASINGRSF
jgi:hypothetical protein